MNKSTLWACTEDEFSEIHHQIIKLKFKPDGWLYPHISQKGILCSMLYDFSQDGLTSDRYNSIVHPAFNYDKKTVIYDYREFANMCRLKTIRTLKKYLSFLVEEDFIQIWIINDNPNLFEAKINLRKITEAPKFPEDE